MTILAPTIADLTPAQTVCNYVDAVVPQRREPAQRRATPTAPGSASSSSPRRRGPTTRAARRRRPPTAAPGPAGQLPAHQPVPEHRVARPAEGVRGRQRAVHSSASRSSATCPGNQGTDDRDDEAGSSDAGAPQTADEPSACRARTARARTPFAVGVVVLVVVVIGVYFGFTKHVPFTHGFRVKAVFESSNSIRTNSPVRIAGVNVGKVTRSRRKPGTRRRRRHDGDRRQGPADPQGRHAEDPPADLPRGQLLRRPQPGTPTAPTIDDGDTIPITQTATPGAARPGADRAADRHARRTCRRCCRASATALTYKPPTAARTRRRIPTSRGQTARRRRSTTRPLRASGAEDTAIVNRRFLGTEPHDLSRLDQRPGRGRRALGRNEAQLKDLVTNFNTTMAAFAVAATTCRRRSALLAPTLQNADRALDALNASFPATRAFAREILPGVSETPATIDAVVPVDRAGARAARPGRAAAASPQRAAAGDARPRQGRSTRRLTLLPQADLVGQVRHAGDPAHRRREDRRRRRSRPAPRTTRSSGTRWSGSPARARTSTATACTCASSPAAATRRSRPGELGGTDRPALRQRGRSAARHAAGLPGQAPALQARRRPATSSRSPTSTRADRPADGGAPRRRGRRRLEASERGRDEDGDPQARARLRLRSLGLVADRALLVGGYILSHQRFYLPDWVPVVGIGLRRLQGRVLDRAGGHAGPGPDGRRSPASTVGEIAKVELEDGRAVVTMKIRRKYTPIYKNATALLRPKTGLKDMVIELDPGTQPAGAAPDGLRRSRSTRRCRTSTPTRSSPRWTPTRATTCSCCRRRGRGRSTATGKPVGRPQALRADRRATWPSSPARWPSASATSAASIHNFSCSRGAGRQGRRPRRARRLLQRASSRPSPTRTPTCARAAAAARRRWTRRTPRWPRSTSWARCSGRRSAPAARRPRARARRWCRRARSCADDADHPEPAAARSRATRCRWSRSCGPAARDLAARHAEPDHARSRSLNYLLNELAYNPPGKEEGYLFWAVVGQPRRRLGLLHPGRARPDPPRRWSWPLLDAAACSTSSAGQSRSSARSARTRSTAPDRRPSGRCAGSRHDVPTAPGADAPCAARGGAARCRSRLPASAGSSSWWASRCRASACCCSCGWPSAARSRCSPRATASTSPSREADAARQGGRRADLRRVGRQGQGRSTPTSDRRLGRDDRARRRVRADPEGHARRSCARRRCWARPTSS